MMTQQLELWCCGLSLSYSASLLLKRESSVYSHFMSRGFTLDIYSEDLKLESQTRYSYIDFCCSFLFPHLQDFTAPGWLADRKQEREGKKPQHLKLPSNRWGLGSNLDWEHGKVAHHPRAVLLFIVWDFMEFPSCRHDWLLSLFLLLLLVTAVKQIICVFISKWMRKLWYLHNLFTIYRVESSDACYSTNELWRYAMWSEPSIKFQVCMMPPPMENCVLISIVFVCHDEKMLEMVMVACWYSYKWGILRSISFPPKHLQSES